MKKYLRVYAKDYTFLNLISLYNKSIYNQFKSLETIQTTTIYASIKTKKSFDNSLDFLELKGILENCTPIDRFQIFPKDKVYIFDLVEHKLLVPLECDENSTLGKKTLHHRVPFVITLLNEHKAIVVYRY